MVLPHARSALVALAVCATLPACTEPGIALKPPQLQQSASNVRDWDAAAARMVRSMAQQGFIPSPPPPGYPPPPAWRTPFPPPYYINVVTQGSTFLAEVKSAIEKDLLLRSLPVARSPVGATVVNLDVNFVQWGQGVIYPGGLLTTLGTVTDVALAGIPQSRTEVVWHASVLSHDRVMMLGSEPLYIAANDVPLYVGSGVQPPPLASPGMPLLGPVEPLRYAKDP